MPNTKTQDPVKDWLAEEEQELLTDKTEAEIESDESAKPLTLASLFEEKKLPFELEDGKMIYFLDAKSIGPADSARMSRMQKLVDALLKRLEKNNDDQDAIARFDRVTTEFVRFILPDLPDESLMRLKYGQKGIVLQHWLRNSDVQSLGKKTNRVS